MEKVYTYNEVINLIRSDKLPSDFNQWHLANNNGWSVAHEAAYYGNLPKDFNQWQLATKKGWTVAHEAAYRNQLPLDFNQWDIVSSDGYSVAHEAAKHGNLPDNFSNWDITDIYGTTVKDIYLEYNGIIETEELPDLEKEYTFDEVSDLIKNKELPSDFDQWDIANDTGWSVAHVAATHNHLPKDFNQWTIANKDGYTVAHEAAKCGNLPKDFDQWDISNDYSWSVAHVAATHGKLPKDFNRWGIANKSGWSVAHEAAYHGNLPKDFNQWSIVYKLGWTVAHTAAAYNHLPKDFNQWDLLDKITNNNTLKSKKVLNLKEVIIDNIKDTVLHYLKNYETVLSGSYRFGYKTKEPSIDLFVFVDSDRESEFTTMIQSFNTSGEVFDFKDLLHIVKISNKEQFNTIKKEHEILEEYMKENKLMLAVAESMDKYVGNHTIYTVLYEVSQLAKSK